jgi:hypothetical protein
VHALFAAADRGVRVRFIVDARFAQKEHDTIDRIARHPGAASSLRRVHRRHRRQR